MQCAVAPGLIVSFDPLLPSGGSVGMVVVDGDGKASVLTAAHVVGARHQDPSGKRVHAGWRDPRGPGAGDVKYVWSRWIGSTIRCSVANDAQRPTRELGLDYALIELPAEATAVASNRLFLPKGETLSPVVGSIESRPMMVSKLGKTTLLTHGELLDGQSEVKIEPKATDKVGATWTSAMRVKTPDGATPFAKKGDSGSIVWDDQKRPVAMVVGGNPKITYVVAIKDVLDELGVSPLGAALPGT